tara:strand:- start:135 stop:605 length:471 start_codon:yes stop_codon:yes gene_type:complete
MVKYIELIHNYKENDPVYYGFEFTEKTDIDYKNILEKTFSENIYNTDRELYIYSWGKMKHTEPKCEVSFDLTKFTTKIGVENVKNLDGRDEKIIISILRHPAFDLLMESVIKEIEENNRSEISFFCNHGKHRSVGWAEIVKKYYYPKSIVKHLRFN